MLTSSEVHYTPTELQIIKLLLMSFSRKKIADIRAISVETVNSHLKHMMMKTDREGIEDLIIFLLTHGFTVNDLQTEVTYKGVIL